MSSPSADFPELMRGLPAAAADLVETGWFIASRGLSAESQRGLLELVHRLANDGAGMAPIVSLLRTLPELLRDAGAWALPVLSTVSHAVLVQSGGAALDALFDRLPDIERRLGHDDALREFLDLVSELTQLAPSALLPLLQNAGTLLERLPVGGLRRWALLGVQAHGSGEDAQHAWFRLESEDSRAILRAAGEGTLFSDVERRLAFYLRALWANEPGLRPASGNRDARKGQRASIVEGGIRLPAAYEAFPGQDASIVYRAAAAHAAAHLAWSTQKFPLRALRPIQVALIALIEDARVEHLAMREMPGLRRLWLPFHVALPTFTVSAVSLMARLSRALIDAQYVDDNPFVAKGRRMFAEAMERLADPGISRQIGNLLGNDLGQMRVQFNFKTYLIEPLYRDDNLHLWDMGDAGQQQSQDQETIYQAVRLEQEAGGDKIDAQVDEQEGGPAEPDKAQLEAGMPDDATEVEDAFETPFMYDEWDYLIGIDRPGWCTVWEKAALFGDPALIDEVMRRNEETVRRLTSMIKAVQTQRPQRLKRQLEGDRLDVDACVEATIDLRTGRTPDPRVHQRLGRNNRDMAVLVLLDLSQSTNDWVPSASSSVLTLAREATALVAHAMQDLGDDFAIHGFDSNGRHEVEYYRFKDFDAPYDLAVRGRLAGMRGQLSTRMGAALRHAGHFLRTRRAAHRLILLLTDGEPHDIDVHDKQYLMFDTKRAVEDQRRYGIATFCLTLDVKADEYVSRIFGARNYMVLDQLRRLPEKLPALYLRLTS